MFENYEEDEVSLEGETEGQGEETEEEETVLPELQAILQDVSKDIEVIDVAKDVLEDASKGLERHDAIKDVVGDVLDVHIIPKPLTKEEASSGLCLLGKTANGLGHAYLMMKVNNKELTDIVIIPTYRHILYVDVSGNRLDEHALSILENVEFLLMLKADENMISSCVLPTLPYLQVLSLSKNEITSTNGIVHPLLENLELNFNQITEVTNLEPSKLRHLSVLELRGNFLRTTAGITCPTIKRLYLAQNMIESIEGLEGLEDLQVLHLRDNPLRSLSGFSDTMSSLTYLNVRGCKIRATKEISKLSVLPKLDTLIIAANILVRRHEDEYRTIILSRLTKLKRIDKGPVREDEVTAADEIRREREEAEEEEESDFEEEEEETIGSEDY